MNKPTICCSYVSYRIVLKFCLTVVSSNFVVMKCTVYFVNDDIDILSTISCFLLRNDDFSIVVQ